MEVFSEELVMNNSYDGNKGVNTMLSNGRRRYYLVSFLIVCFISALCWISDYSAKNPRTVLVNIERVVTSYQDINNKSTRTRTIEERTQHLRIKLLQNECKKARALGKQFTREGARNLVISTKYQFLYCPVAKVAEANWKRVIMVLGGLANSTGELHHSDVLGKDGKFYQTIPTIEARFQHFTTFLFVRHPFKRLLSAYRNKFENPDEWGMRYPKNYGRNIIRKYRPNASHHALHTGYDVTFPEFVQYLLDESENAPELLNIHWRPAYLCGDVCNRGFNFIGKFETLQEDALYVLNKINASHVVTFPESESCATHVTNSSQEDTYRNYYKQLLPENIERLYKLYELDFRIFGYKFPLELFEAKVAS